MSRVCHYLALVSWLVLPAFAPAADYYFSAAGNDQTGNGTIDSPWRNPGAILAMTPPQDGDRYFLRGGDTFTSGFSAGGGVAEPIHITITSYGTGRATIASGSAPAIQSYNAGGWTISNLNLVGDGNSWDSGIDFYIDAPNTRFAGPTITNVDVSGYGGDGIRIGSNDSSKPYYSPAATQGWDGVTIDNVNAHHNRVIGVFVYGQTTSSNTNVVIRNSTAAHNGSHGLLIGNTDGGVIERSLAHHNGQTDTGVVGIWAYDANNITIQYNEAYAQKTNSNVDGGGFDLDGGVTNSVMQYNYSHDNDGAGFLLGEYDGSKPTSGNVVRFNISENDGQANNYGGIFIYNFSNDSSNVTNNAIYNNTVFNNSGGANLVLRGNLAGASNLVANNIFVTADDVALIRDTRTDQTSGVQLLNNAYWTSGDGVRIIANGRTYRSMQAWLNAFTSQERLDSNNDGTVNHQDAIIAIIMNPGFLDLPGGGEIIGDPYDLASLTAYQLLNTSDLANAGLDLTASPFFLTIGGVDYYGIPIAQGTAISVGASEVVPEPGGLGLIGLGAVGLLRRARRPVSRERSERPKSAHFVRR